MTLIKDIHQTGSTPPRWLFVLSLFVLMLAVIYIAGFFILAGIRAAYPFELEWIEGTNIDEMLWIMHGNPLYGDPSIYFIPLAYNPLYFILSAGLMKILGVGFLVPRLFSILATLGCFFLLFLIVTRDTGRIWPGIIAAGIYAASYRLAGAWMDLAKTDSLFLFFLLAAFYISRKSTKPKWLVVSGVFYVLSYYTKQLALPIILVMGVSSLIEYRGRTWPLWFTTAMLGGAIFLGTDQLTNHWYSFYSVNILTYHAHTRQFWYFWRTFITHMWPALLVGLIYPVYILTGNLSRVPENFWQNLSFIAALIIASWSVFMKVWTYDNGFMPACIAAGLFASLGAGEIFKIAQRSSWNQRTSILNAGVLILLAVQFGVLYYPPLEQIPTAKDRAAAQQFVDQVKQLPGEVLVYDHGYINYLAGKTSYFQSVPYGDVVGGVYPPRTESDRQRIDKIAMMVKTAFQEQVFNWIITDKPEDSRQPYYIYAGNLFADTNVLYPVTGAHTRPESLLVKNPFVKGGQIPLTDPSFEHLFLKGWSLPQNGGRWATRNQSVLMVPLEKVGAYEAGLEIQPFCTGQHPMVHAMTILWNDQIVDSIAFNNCQSHNISFEIPANWIKKIPNNLAFKFEESAGSTNPGSVGEQGAKYVRFTSISFSQK